MTASQAAAAAAVGPGVPRRRETTAAGSAPSSQHKCRDRELTSQAGTGGRRHGFIARADIMGQHHRFSSRVRITGRITSRHHTPAPGASSTGRRHELASHAGPAGLTGPAVRVRVTDRHLMSAARVAFNNGVPKIRIKCQENTKKFWDRNTK